jgi:nitrogen fixation/metabolism regulation signal transduction histidine kinase
MVFKSLQLNIIIRVLLIAVTIGGFMYIGVVQHLYIRSSYLVILFIVQLIELVRYLNKSARDLNSYFQSILQDDFSTSFSTADRSKSYKELYRSMKLVNKKLSDISTAKEIQFQYLETIIAHIQVALISFDDTENIFLINESAKKLLGKPIINSLAAIDRFNHKIAEAARTITPEKQLMVNTVVDGETQRLAVRCAEFKLEDRHYKLVTFQNIKYEMEAQEVESWQKLIRVLTHEIMNSVAPITSLSGTLHDLVQNQKLIGEKKSSWINNLTTGLDAIKTRSYSLQTFTESYQNLTHLPKPKFKLESVGDLLNETKLLFKNIADEQGIAINIECINKLEHHYDKSMISQVLVNLLKNSIEALKGQRDAAISIRASSIDGMLRISVKDNGQGVEEKYLVDVFVPFFTTKEDGSGIGLALSRQILHLHNGSIRLNTQPGSGAEFILTL